MPLTTYQAFAKKLKELVRDERKQCVIDKTIVLTAAAAIDELVKTIERQAEKLGEDQIIIEKLQQVTERNKATD